MLPGLCTTLQRIWLNRNAVNRASTQQDHYYMAVPHVLALSSDFLSSFDAPLKERVQRIYFGPAAAMLEV